MMADNDANIIYMNKTVEKLFRDAEEDIRQDLPDFDAAVLLVPTSISSTSTHNTSVGC